MAPKRFKLQRAASDSLDLSGGRYIDLYTESVEHFLYRFISWFGTGSESLIQTFPTQAGFLCYGGHTSGFGNMANRCQEYAGVAHDITGRRSGGRPSVADLNTAVVAGT